MTKKDYINSDIKAHMGKLNIGLATFLSIMTFYLDDLDMPLQVDLAYKDEQAISIGNKCGSTMGEGQLEQLNVDDIDSYDKCISTKVIQNNVVNNGGSLVVVKR